MLGSFAANRGRLQRAIDALATFGKVGPTAITRLAFTPEDKAAHDHVAALMHEAGMATRYDAFGNLFGERPGTDPDAKPVVTGSHLDGPPDGGVYDGVIGVIAGLEACRMLDEAGVKTRNAIQVVAVRAEHLDRFGLSTLGSRALSGKLKAHDLERLRDADGISLRQALLDNGFAPDDLASVNLKDRIHAWLELHVEQGRVLEDVGKQIGVVTAIAGPTRYKVKIKGMADHSGATPMSIRKDALCGAAEIVLDLERLAGATADCVGTIGIIRAFPGAVHTIPGEVELFVDIRGVRRDDKAELVAKFTEMMQKRCDARRLGLSYDTYVSEHPVPCSPWLVESLTELCKELGASFHVMPSGGGHDTQHVAAVADAAMLFIPSARGIAHTPEEYTTIEDVAAGTEFLAEALYRLADGRLAPKGSARADTAMAVR
jgi:hydantoinase/carbamoylase family amidase